MCQFVKFLRSPPSRHHISLFKFTNSARAKVKTFTHFNKKSNTETLIFAHNPHFVQQIPHRPLTYRIYRIYRGYSNYPPPNQAAAILPKPKPCSNSLNFDVAF